MRLLVLAPSCPFPARNGVHLRLSNLLHRLPSGTTVRLHCFDEGSEVRVESLPEPLNGELVRVPLPARPTGWRASTPVQALRLEPTMIWRFRSPLMAALTSEHGRQVDGVLAIGLQMGQYLNLLPAKLPRALDNYNVESLIIQRLAETRTGLKRCYWSWEAAKMRRCERRLLERAGDVFAISETDREGMGRLGARSRLHTVPMGIDLSYFRPQPVPVVGAPPRFTFVGAFNWHVNEDAAVWVCSEIWPRIRAELPTAELRLVGRDPSPAVRALGATAGVTVVGTVPDVRPYLWDSTAIVVPLRYGSGVRTKILEGFAVGRPVVSTSVGAEGLLVTDRQQLLIADEAAAFAACCVQLAREPQLAGLLVEQGLQFVAEQDRQATQLLRQTLNKIFGTSVA